MEAGSVILLVDWVTATQGTPVTLQAVHMASACTCNKQLCAVTGFHDLLWLAYSCR